MWTNGWQAQIYGINQLPSAKKQQEKKSFAIAILNANCAEENHGFETIDHYQVYY